MKRIFFLLFASLLFSQEKSIWDYHPVHVGGNAIGVFNADIRKAGDKKGNLQYIKENAFLYCFLPINHCNFFLPRIEYNHFTMDWSENPRFEEKDFQFVQFALSFLSTSIEKWRWIIRGDYNIDVDHFSNPKEYSLFSLLLWGIHEAGPNWNFHIGAFGYTGFSGQNVYPVIGFDYFWKPKWTLQAVFPISYAIEYAFNDRFRLSLKGRPLKERFRCGEHQSEPKSIFNYSTMGAELNLHYEKFLQLEIEVFAGYNFGGSFYIKDQKGKSPLYTHVEGAPYAGVSLNWGL